MSPRDDDLLGNLPRSRPGTRSRRRPDPPDASSDPVGPGGVRHPPEEHGPPLATDADLEATAGGDPLSGAVRAAGNLARYGVRTAGRVTGGLLGRLRR